MEKTSQQVLNVTYVFDSYILFEIKDPCMVKNRLGYCIIETRPGHFYLQNFKGILCGKTLRYQPLITKVIQVKMQRST